VEPATTTTPSSPGKIYDLIQCFPTFFSLQPAFTHNFWWGTLRDIAVKPQRKKSDIRKKHDANKACSLLLMGSLSLLITYDKIKLKLDRALINLINRKSENFQESFELHTGKL